MRNRLLVIAVPVLVAMGAVAAWQLGDDGPAAALSVYPGEGTPAASARTVVTFRNVDPDELDDVVVTGSRSGRHPGRLRAHPDGHGAAFVPDRPFTAGERVTVDAGVPVAGGSGDRVRFTVALGSRPPGMPFDDAEPVPKSAPVEHFKSRPDLRPPEVAVDTLGDRAAPGLVFVAPKRGESQQGPMILDREGKPVWFQPLEGDEQAFDFRAQEYRGKPVLTWWQGRVALYRGDGVGRILDTSYRPVATVRAANGYEFDGHEFKLTPRGTALLMSYETLPWDLSALGGRRDGLVEDNIVQEIDVATGALLFEWHALGHIPMGESYRPAPKEKGKIHDPFHLNSIDEEPNGNLVISARHMNAVYEIDRRTGDVRWRLGGKESDFDMGEGTEFKLQHDARMHPDGTITLFDNVEEELPAPDKQSRGIRIALDRRAKKATLVRQYQHPDKLLSPTQGSMEALEGGGAFVGWGGSQPVFSEFDADGGTVFSARFLPKRVESYRAYRMPWSAKAPGRPSVAVASKGGRTTVHVSWNGATDVSSWRVRAGEPGGLAESAEAPRAGFETAIPVDGSPSAVAVDALDESGRVLGSSDEVAVGG